MREVNLSMVRNGADTKTMMDLGKVIEMKPHLSRTIVTMYPNLSLSNLTEALGRVYSKESVRGKRLQEIDSFSFEWMIKKNQIPTIEFAEDCNETGEGGAEVRAILKQKYYDPHDTFKLDNGQLLYVKRPGRMLATDKWEYWVRLVSSDLKKRIDVRYMRRGSKTRYVSNYHPELSERGYSKFMFNLDKHRNYISRHRHGDSFSGDFASLRNKYMEHAGMMFKMNEFDKDLLDQFYFTREWNMIWGQSNFDVFGKCLITEQDGRPIPMGDGLIAQIERFCGQQRYSVLTKRVLDQCIEDVVSKMEKKTGNTIVVLCNFKMYVQVQHLLDSILAERATDAYFYSVEDKKVAVGAEYNAYKFAGNTLVFTENEAITTEYENQGFGIFFDGGNFDGEPNVSMVTLEGRQLIRGVLKGMGGTSGRENGDIATTVDGSRIEYLGYSGIKVANPYAAHILKENVIF